MDMKKLIAAQEFCARHNIEVSFIHSLEETGLIEMKTIEQTGFIPVNQLQQLEKMVRLYYELGINLEGIDTITHLLERITDLQNQVRELQNKLRFFEIDPWEDKKNL